MAAVLVTGPTVTQDFPRGGCSHNHYSFLPTHGETAQAESTCLPVCIPRWFTRPKTVTHPGTNRAWQRVMELRRNSMCIFLFSCNFYHQDSIDQQTTSYFMWMSWPAKQRSRNSSSSDGSKVHAIRTYRPLLNVPCQKILRLLRNTGEQILGCIVCTRYSLLFSTLTTQCQWISRTVLSI